VRKEREIVFPRHGGKRKRRKKMRPRMKCSARKEELQKIINETNGNLEATFEKKEKEVLG